jgi:hypothetical protein
LWSASCHTARASPKLLLLGPSPLISWQTTSCRAADVDVNEFNWLGQNSSKLGKLTRRVFFRRKFDTFIIFTTSLLAASVKKWPWRPKIRHGFDMAGEKFDMPSGPGTLVARTLLLVKLQPAQTGSVMSSCYQKRRAEARRWHSARQNRSKIETYVQKFDMVLAKFDMSSTSKVSPQKNCIHALSGRAAQSTLIIAHFCL